MLGTLSLWADFAYEFNQTLVLFKLTKYATISNPSFSCAAATLSADLKIHIPDVLLPDGSTHIWVDLEYASALSVDGNIYFLVKNYGVVAGTSVVGEFSSGSAGGIVSTGNGFQIVVERDTIPFKTDGTSANVKFTIETAVQPPAPLSQGFAQVGDIAKFGPDGFSFAWPVTTVIPVSDSLADLTDVKFLQYYPDQAKWFPLPMMAYNDNGQKVTSITSSVYELGYATLAKSSSASSLSLANQGDDGSTANGAFRWYVPNSKCPGVSQGGTLQGCHFYFKPENFTPKYPDQEALYPNGWREDAFLRTGSNSTGSPADSTVFSLMQGTWEFCVTASEYTIPGSSLPIPGKWTYQKLVKVTINAASRNMTQSLNSYDGWTNIGSIDSSNGNIFDGSVPWKEPSESTACPTNPNPTIPVGSGDFQATLTWSNTASSSSDVDLHLYGPDSLHIYYQYKTQNNLTLDRDWRYDLGNAVENIYNTGSMPKGSYKLAVQLFGGASPTSYRVRVIQGGNVKTYEKSISVSGTAGEQTIMEFTVDAGSTGGADIAGLWKMEGHQNIFPDALWKADLTLSADGTLFYKETYGNNAGATRTGTWSVSGNSFSMEYIAPTVGLVKWIGTLDSPMQNISNGTYSTPEAGADYGGTWAASKQP
jgi:hypothetical protein